MPCFCRAALAALAVAVTLMPQVATAGLISWSYQVQLHGDGSLPNTQSWVDVSEPEGSFTSTGEGIRAVLLHRNLAQPTGAASGGDLFRGDAFTLTVHITDTASGESGQVKVSGGFGVDW